MFNIDDLTELPRHDAKEIMKKLERRGIYLLLSSIKEDICNIEEAIVLSWSDKETAKKTPLYFLIDSQGGEALEGWSIYNKIRNYPGPTIGVVLGKAYSIAFLILQACKFRFALPGTYGLIHSIRIDKKITAYNAEEIESVVKRVARLTEEMLMELHEKTGMPIEELNTLAKIDNTFNLSHYGTAFIDATIRLVPPFNPLPDEWLAKIEESMKA